MAVERTQSTSDAVFQTVHALALRGHLAQLAPGTEELLSSGLVHAVDGGFQLTQLGYSSHRAMRERERATLDLGQLAMVYSPLPALHRRLVRLRGDWSVPHGPLAQRRIVAALGQLLEDTAVVLRRACLVAPRFGAYQPRLARALVTLRAGELGFAFDPDVDSIGAVWRELHEDFLQTLGRAHELEEV